MPYLTMMPYHYFRNPLYLLEALAGSGRRGLTIIKNDANEPGVGVGQLLRAGVLSRLITSHIGLNPEVVAAMNEGRIEVDFYPQGILAEKIRCGGAGLPAFLSDIGVGLLPERGATGWTLRETISWRGERYFLEPALRADLALVHAHRADIYGNLVYRSSARNFNPLMATAAERVVVEVEGLAEEAFDPDRVHTPGCYVDHLMSVPAHFDPGTKAAAFARRET